VISPPKTNSPPVVDSRAAFNPSAVVTVVWAKDENEKLNIATRAKMNCFSFINEII
jgi:hypothetical protein